MRTDTAHALKPRGRGLVLLAVLLLHLGGLALLQQAWRGPATPPHQDQDQRRSTMRIISLTLPPLRPATPAAPTAPTGAQAPVKHAQAAPSPARPDDPRRPPRDATASRLRMAPLRQPEATAPAEAPATTPATASITSPDADTPAVAAAPAASGAQRLLDSEATRRAIRQAATAPLLAERADQSSQAPDRLGPSGKLGQEIKKAGNGDCLKGEFAGAGAGLLSLPFWLLAEARGKCAK